MFVPIALTPPCKPLPALSDIPYLSALFALNSPLIFVLPQFSYPACSLANLPLPFGYFNLSYL